VLLISCKTKKKNGMSLNKMEIKWYWYKVWGVRKLRSLKQQSKCTKASILPIILCGFKTWSLTQRERCLRTGWWGEYFALSGWKQQKDRELWITEMGLENLCETPHYCWAHRALINEKVPQKGNNFMTNWGMTGLSQWPRFHGVSQLRVHNSQPAAPTMLTSDLGECTSITNLNTLLHNQ
jgi:hypothetical protein